MARCAGAGRDGPPCEFSTDQIGAPAWVRAPAVRCVWCESPSRLQHLVAGDGAGEVWATLARLSILDDDVFCTALLRIPPGDRKRAVEQARRAACQFRPTYPLTRMQQRTLFHMNATQALLRSATRAPDLRRRAREDARTLGHLHLCMGRLPPSVAERIFTFGAVLDAPSMRSELARVKQAAYNLGCHPLFWPVSTDCDLPPQEALVECYRLGFIVHQQSMQRLSTRVPALLLAAERANCHEVACAVTKVLRLTSAMI